MPSTPAISVAQTATLSVSNSGISTEDMASGRSKAVGSENLSCSFAAEQGDKRACFVGVATAPQNRHRVANRHRGRNLDRDLDLATHDGSVGRVDKTGVRFFASDVIEHLPHVQRKDASRLDPVP